MGFQVDKFMATQFQPREEAVEVSELKPFFNGKKAVWKIRGLNGVEIARARESQDKSKIVKSVVDGLVSNSEKKKADAIWGDDEDEK